MTNQIEDIGTLSEYYGPYSVVLTHSYSAIEARDWIITKRVDSPMEAGRMGYAFAGERNEHTQRYTRALSAFRYYMEAVRDMVYIWPVLRDESS